MSGGGDRRGNAREPARGGVGALGPAPSRPATGGKQHRPAGKRQAGAAESIWNPNLVRPQSCSSQAASLQLCRLGGSGASTVRRRLPRRRGQGRASRPLPLYFVRPTPIGQVLHGRHRPPPPDDSPVLICTASAHNAPPLQRLPPLSQLGHPFRLAATCCPPGSLSAASFYLTKPSNTAKILVGARRFRPSE